MTTVSQEPGESTIVKWYLNQDEDDLESFQVEQCVFEKLHVIECIVSTRSRRDIL